MDKIVIPPGVLPKNKSIWKIPYVGQFYLYLLSHMGSGDEWDVSFKQIQRDLGLSRRQYRTALEKLTEANLLTSSAATQKTTSPATDCPETSAHKHRAAATSASNSATTRKATQQDGFARFMNYFNQVVSETAIPKITKLTDRRKTALKNIFKEYGKDTVEIALRKVLASDFLCGREKKWRATFDWIFNKTNFQKILEDTYDNRQQPPATSSDRYSTRRGTDVGNFTESDYEGPF